MFSIFHLSVWEMIPGELIYVFQNGLFQQLQVEMIFFRQRFVCHDRIWLPPIVYRGLKWMESLSPGFLMVYISQDHLMRKQQLRLAVFRPDPCYPQRIFCFKRSFRRYRHDSIPPGMNRSKSLRLHCSNQVVPHSNLSTQRL